MRELYLSELTDTMFFWRKDGTRWFLAEPKTLGCCPDSDPTNIIALKDEKILSDPNICDSCWSELDWPPTSKCSNCGALEKNRETIEAIKAYITEWCGASDPHI